MAKGAQAEPGPPGPAADGAARDVAVCELEAQRCRTLGDVTRLRIVHALAGGPLSATGRS